MPTSHLSHTGIVCFVCIQTVHHHLSQGEILLWAPKRNTVGLHLHFKQMLHQEKKTKY